MNPGTAGPAAFAGLLDLASERLGGQALLANDEFFAAKECLTRKDAAVFDPAAYTERGKLMDGWETRRRRTPGHDWCILRLGVPGILQGADIDTSHFLGNHPPYASLEACIAPADARPEALAEPGMRWTEILPRSPLDPGSHNLVAITHSGRWTHVRLNIYPDGGVARLRLYGTPAPDWSAHAPGSTVDLAAAANGGSIVAASDMFFGAPANMILPGRSGAMNEGWETRRRRGPGNDWAIVKLARPGRVTRVEVDTHHFKGNAPAGCSLDGCATAGGVDILNWAESEWKELLARSPLDPDASHQFERGIAEFVSTHVRLQIYPDGGVSRLRVYATLAP